MCSGHMDSHHLSWARSTALARLVPPHSYPLSPPLPFQSRHPNSHSPGLRDENTEWGPLVRGRGLESPSLGTVTTLSPPPPPKPLILLLPCQAVATSRISRVRGPMASAGKWQADVGLADGQRTGFLDTSSEGTRPTRHVFLSTGADCLSCFPLPSSPWADPPLPLLARQGNHRVWKSWLKKKKTKIKT